MTHSLLLFVLLVCFCSLARAAGTDVQLVARQFREYSMREAADRGDRLLDDADLPATSARTANKWLASLGADGSWPDVDYASDDRSSWRPFDHLTRVLGLVLHARRNDTSPADFAKAIEGVHRALTFWAKNDFKCPNWWYNEIGTPKTLGNIALLLDADLAPDERKYIADTVLARSKVGGLTGQNRVWLAANGLMRGVLLNDEPLVQTAAGVIHDEVRVGTDEGVQPDFSFYQHGPQQQFGNYGLAWAVEMSRWATVLRGTRFAFPNEKLAIVHDYLLDGENWVVWRGAMDISSCGRQLFPNSPRSKARAVAGVMRTMAVVDPAHEKDYLAFIARNRKDATENDLVGTRYFWRSDYLVHRRPEWFASLKMSSSRVIGGETVNKENLSGLHLADGATFFYRTGHEYDEIFPAWDWRKIPGTTSEQDDRPLSWPKWDKTKFSEFVGAAGDDDFACAAMDFRRGELRAKKAWLFAGDVVVCLGAGITSSGTAPVVTAVNQCIRNGEVRVYHDGREDSVASGQHEVNSPGWVAHDGLRYVFPADQRWTVKNEKRTGNWRSVFDSSATPKADVTKDLFTVEIDHGKSGSYAYHVLPATEPHEGRVEILSNTPELQAVGVDRHWYGAVFWKPGATKVQGVPVEVDQPCVMAFEANVGLRTMIADPTQKLERIRVTINGSTRDVNLPRGGDAGKAVPVK